MVVVPWAAGGHRSRSAGKSLAHAARTRTMLTAYPFSSSLLTTMAGSQSRERSARASATPFPLV